VRYSYRGAAPVLADVDLAVEAGEVLAVHGGNGAGKTTLLRLIAGVLLPRAGTVRCQGRIGYLPQRSDEPPPRLAASAWLAALDRMGGRPDGSDRLAALRSLGVQDGTAPMDTLSVGTVAKVLLAGATGGSPGVLVLDEPFAALDADARAVALALIEAAAGDGAAVVVSDHEGAAAHVATSVATISGGRLVVQGAGHGSPSVHVVGVAADGSSVDAVVPADERDRLLLQLLRDGGQVLRVEDVP